MPRRTSSDLLDDSKPKLRLAVVDYGYEEPNSPEPLVQPYGNKSWIVRWKNELVADLRSANWARITLGCLLGMWTFGLFLLSTTFPVYLYSRGVNYSFWFKRSLSSRWNEVGCLPNDVFNARDGNVNIFDPSGFFQITHGFGKLSFTEAKVVDVVWDIMVGRAGQSILAYFSWKAFSAYFKHRMSKEPVSYNLYWTVFIHDQPSFHAVWQTIRDAYRQQARRSKSVLIFVILSMIFILVFPTFVSAMTGYRPNSKAFVLDMDNNLIPLDKFARARYIIHDGERIGHKRDYIVTCDEGSGDCNEVFYAGRYVDQYGFFALNNETGETLDIPTTFGDIEVPKPALNISAFYLRQSESGHNWFDPRSNTKPFSNESNDAMYQTGTASTTYTYDYIQEYGSCVQQQTYQWGFSFLQVFVMSILLLIWTCGTFAMWLGAHKALVQHVDQDVPSGFKAAYVLATSMDLQLINIKKSTALLTSKQLEKTVENELAGGRLMTEDVVLSEVPNYSIRREVWGWIKQHPFWSFWFFLLTGYLTWWPLTFYSIGWNVVFAHPSIMALHLGSVIAVVVGSTKKNKAFFVFAGAVMGALVWTAVLFIP